MATDKELIKAAGSELATSDQRFNWTGLNPSQMKSVAQAMAISGMFPDIEKDSAKAFVKIMAGQEMGIPPFQAMSDIAIIEGKAAPGGNIHATKVKSSGRYDYRVTKWDLQGCELEFFETIAGKRQTLGVSSFTKDDALMAGLVDETCDFPVKHNIRKITRYKKGGGSWQVDGCGCKDNWKKYPRAMYFNRAMTAGERAYCPDVLGGINAYMPEELGATVDESGRAIGFEPPEATPTNQPDAQEGEVVHEVKTGTPLVALIGKELAAKGFDNKIDRQTIALKLAGVTAVADADDATWQEVLDYIKGATTEKLHELLIDPLPPEEEDDTPPPSVVDEAHDVTDEELEALDSRSVSSQPNPPEPQPYIVPDFQRGSTVMPKPTMVGLFSKWSKEYGLTTSKALEKFTQKVIGKNKPSTFDDFEMLLNVLADEMNAKIAQGTLI